MGALPPPGAGDLGVANVILFHSVLGLRDTERNLAARWREAGHTVILPDLFDGASTDDIDEGFAIKERVGWVMVRSRAIEALGTIGDPVVLAGISMGAGVVAEAWPACPYVAGILLIHGVLEIPKSARAGTPIQLHIGAVDPFFPERVVSRWKRDAQGTALAPEVFIYRDAGHYFLDRRLPDFSAAAASLAERRCASFLDRHGGVPAPPTTTSPLPALAREPE